MDYIEVKAKTIDDAISLGKNTIGIVTGNFENINQINDYKILKIFLLVKRKLE